MASVSPSYQPTWYGYLDSTKDALILVEACLQGMLTHVPRRLYSDEANAVVKSGAIFVTEEGASGFWDDYRCWAFQGYANNFTTFHESSRVSIDSVTPAKDCTLEKKSITISFNGIQHQVVSYYTDDDRIGGRLSLPSTCEELQFIHIRAGLNPTPMQNGEIAGQFGDK